MSVTAVLLDRDGEPVLKHWEYRRPAIEKPFAIVQRKNDTVVYHYVRAWKHKGVSPGYGVKFELEPMSGEDKAQYHGGSGRHNAARIRHKKVGYGPPK